MHPRSRSRLADQPRGMSFELSIALVCNVLLWIELKHSGTKAQRGAWVLRELSLSTVPDLNATSLLPGVRPIEGVSQLPFLLNPLTTESPRERFLFYIKSELPAIKWCDWKLYYVYEPKVNQSTGRLESPYLFNTTRDPKVDTSVAAYNTWVLHPMLRMKTKFDDSLKRGPALKDD